MEPLLIVASLFAMSLGAAIVLFKWLENTAVVKLPFGQFGGAIAGFIGVFLILQRSYTALATVDSPPAIAVPAGYKTYISELFGIGVGYPREFELTPIGEMRTIGNLKISDDGANIGMGLQPLQGDELGDLNMEEATNAILDSNFGMLTMMFPDALFERTSYSMNAIRGEKLEIQFEVAGIELRTVQVVIPHFENQAIYFFNLTSRPEHIERDQAVFDDVLSTVSFF